MHPLQADFSPFPSNFFPHFHAIFSHFQAKLFLLFRQMFPLSQYIFSLFPGRFFPLFRQIFFPFPAALFPLFRKFFPLSRQIFSPSNVCKIPWCWQGFVKRSSKAPGFEPLFSSPFPIPFLDIPMGSPTSPLPVTIPSAVFLPFPAVFWDQRSRGRQSSLEGTHAQLLLLSLLPGSTFPAGKAAQGHPHHGWGLVFLISQTHKSKFSLSQIPMMPFGPLQMHFNIPRFCSFFLPSFLSFFFIFPDLPFIHKSFGVFWDPSSPTGKCHHHHFPSYYPKSSLPASPQVTAVTEQVVTLGLMIPTHTKEPPKITPNPTRIPKEKNFFFWVF